ncbi:hypothetical protein ACROYT_G022809 [Oculina patagonica]
MSQVHSLQLEDIHSEDSLANETRQKESENHDLRRRELARKFRPILRLMKLTGEFYGDISMDDAVDADASVFPRVYCAMVLLGQWFVVVQSVTSLFIEGLAQMQIFFFLLIFSIWYLQCAVVNTICLFTLPKGRKTPSRLGQFISNLSATTSDISGIKTFQVNLLLAFVCLFAVFNTVCLVLLDFYRNTSVPRFRPWNGLLPYRLIQLGLYAFVAFAWALPFTLFHVSCKLLVGIFENLEKKISTKCPTVPNIESLRQEHRKLCETVAVADKVFSPLILVAVALDVPLICINFYQLVKSPSSSKEDIAFVISIIYWCIAVTVKLAFIMISGVKVNEKIHSFYDTLHKITVSGCKEHLELLQFLMHLRGEPIGLSVGGLAVMTSLSFFRSSG